MKRIHVLLNLLFLLTTVVLQCIVLAAPASAEMGGRIYAEWVAQIDSIVARCGDQISVDELKYSVLKADWNLQIAGSEGSILKETYAIVSSIEAQSFGKHSKIYCQMMLPVVLSTFDERNPIAMKGSE